MRCPQRSNQGDDKQTPLRTADATANETRLSGGDLAQNSAQLVKIHWLGEMEIESRFSAALNVLSRSKATEGHGCYRSFALRMSHNVVAAPIRQGDVAQNDVELFRFDRIQRVLRAIGQRNFMAEMREKTRQRLQVSL